MNEYDVQSKLIRKLLEDKKEAISTAKYVKKEVLTADNELCNRGIKELVRLIDSGQNGYEKMQREV